MIILDASGLVINPIQPDINERGLNTEVQTPIAGDLSLQPYYTRLNSYKTTFLYYSQNVSCF